jgi:hypothetical protein
MLPQHIHGSWRSTDDASGCRRCLPGCELDRWGESETEPPAVAVAVHLGGEDEGVEDPNVLAVSHHLLTIFESASEIAASLSVAAC